MVPTGPVDRFDAFRALAERRGRPGQRLHQRTGAPGQVFCSCRFPASGVNRATSEHADTATSCPEYQVTAVRVHDASTGGAR
ncbi:hypothetical protein [Streptomyces sp. CoH27]|uniref:hypothetical protein n=1 Tax=Streptomyces sp. CoH27 TaxID=2875763 RepID=UPI001CD1F392|nr:hypothetical protein [Streptomyces sp. CoH27]